MFEQVKRLRKMPDNNISVCQKSGRPFWSNGHVVVFGPPLRPITGIPRDLPKFT